MKKPDYHLAKNVDLEIRLLDEEEAPATPGLFVILVFPFLTLTSSYDVQPFLNRK